MHTQCPYCQTLFRINAVQLKAASGKAHCCHCDRVFDALKNLCEQDPDHDWPASRPSDPNELQQQLPLAPARNELVDLLQQLGADRMIAPKIKLNPNLGTQFLEQRKRDDVFTTPADQTTPPPVGAAVEPRPGPDTQPAPPAMAEEGLHLPEPATDTAWPINNESTTETRTRALPFDLPGDLADIEPTEQETLTTEQRSRRGKAPHTLAWSMLIILLLLMALGQLAWYERDLVLQYPEGRRLLGQVCHQIKCTLPPRKAPQMITVISRTITAHPTNPQALQVSLTLINQANFRQPHPLLQLSLYTTEEHLVARRTFNPDEYNSSSQSLAPGQSFTIRFDLEDPGEQVTGFKFDFL